MKETGPSRSIRGWTLAAAALAGSLLACRAPRAYLWVDEVPDPSPPAPGEYHLVTGDVLSVRVWNQESMSTPRARVREDGRISLPFLQDVEVAGMTTAELSSRLAVKLKAYVVNPVVTVALEERRPLRVSVLGEVTRPGEYQLALDSGILHALAAAGGLTEYAHGDRIFVLRHGYWADGNPAPARIRFAYDAIVEGSKKAAAFRLRNGDVVVVE